MTIRYQYQNLKIETLIIDVNVKVITLALNLFDSFCDNNCFLFIKVSFQIPSLRIDGSQLCDKGVDNTWRDSNWNICH
jgi:hypothetical protein